MTQANKNLERTARGNDPAGVRDPNADTVDSRGAALEKSVQAAQNAGNTFDGFAYQAKIHNASKQVVEVVFWEYQFIDSGNPGGRDAGRIHRAAQVAGLKKIDHYLTTHFHTDHFGGAAELSALMPIGQVYDNGIPESEPNGNRQDTRWPLLIR